MIYLYLASYGTHFFWKSLFAFASGHPWLAVHYGAISVAGAGPVLVLCAMGRDRLFNFVARRLESNAMRRQQDGAFVASLVEAGKHEVEQPWWLHREAGDQDTTYPEFEYCRNWRKGFVVEIGELAFGVKLKGVRLTVSGQPGNRVSSIISHLQHVACRRMSTSKRPIKA